MNPRWDILGLGVVTVDDILYVARYPEVNTKLPVQASRREGGGLTATALVAAARFGAATAYAAVLGDDELSRFSFQALEREGVDCSPIRRQAEARPPYSLIIVDQSSGQRTILYSNEGVIRYRAEDVTEALVANCRVILVDNREVLAALRAVEIARTLGIPVVGDIEPELEPEAPELMRQIDHLIVSFELAAQVTGETQPERILSALMTAGRACCVITAGEQGGWYAIKGEPVCHFPAFPVQAVDTTGCGDVFHGVYAAGLARGENIPKIIQMAAAAAALKATQPGGRSGIPTRAVVESFLTSYKSNL